MPFIKIGDRLIETDALVGADWHDEPGQPLHLRVLIDGGHAIHVGGPEAEVLRDWLLATCEYRDLMPPAAAPEAAPAVPEGERAFDTWLGLACAAEIANLTPLPPQQQQGDPVPPVKFREFL